MTLAAAVNRSARADHRHRHGAALGHAGDIDMLRVGRAVGNELFDQLCDKGDVVRTIRRRAAGAIGIGAEISPGAVEPIWKDHAKTVAPGDCRP